MALMMYTGILTLLSIVLLVALLVIYSKNMRSLRSSFTVGLFVFALLFLIQNVVSAYYYWTMMSYYAPEVEIQVFVLSLLQTAAFGLLLYITSR